MPHIVCCTNHAVSAVLLSLRVVRVLVVVLLVGLAPDAADGLADDALVTDEMLAVPPPFVFGRLTSWKGRARLVLGFPAGAPCEAGFSRITSPGKAGLRPVALDVVKAGLILSIAGPLPFAMTSTLQP